MFIQLIIVLFYYVKSLLLATFHLKSNKALYLCGINLTKRSFRVTEAERNNYFIVIKRSLSDWKKFILSSSSRKDVITGDSVVYDLTEGSRQIRQDYLEHFTGDKWDNFIFKSELLSQGGLLEKLLVSFLFFLILPFWFFITLFSKHKSSLAMFMCESIENARLLSVIKKSQANRVFFFSIYEKDANLAAYLLMRNNIYVVKIPSEVPLYFFNTAVLTNKLILCNAYQKEELEVYKTTLHYNEVEFWGPEQMTRVFDVYKKKNYTIQRNTIAFYSTASWVREKEGHMDQGTNMVKNEIMLLEYLSEFLKTNTIYKLLVYLHPKEKSDQYVKEAKSHYSKYLNGIKFDFAPFDMPSSASFYNAEMAVPFNSTLIHERLYFGFKTLILPLDHPGFPVKDSGLSNICCFSKEELFTKLSNSFLLDENAFFEKNNLTNYRSPELF